MLSIVFFILSSFFSLTILLNFLSARVRRFSCFYFWNSAMRVISCFFNSKKVLLSLFIFPFNSTIIFSFSLFISLASWTSLPKIPSFFNVYEEIISIKAMLFFSYITATLFSTKSSKLSYFYCKLLSTSSSFFSLVKKYRYFFLRIDSWFSLVS